MHAFWFQEGKRRAFCALVTQSMKSLSGTASLLPLARNAEDRVTHWLPNAGSLAGSAAAAWGLACCTGRAAPI